MKITMTLPVTGLLAGGLLASAEPSMPASTWAQPYAVLRNSGAGTLDLGVPYYNIRFDLNRGGTIAGIRLTRGQAANLLVQPVETQVTDAAGKVYSDLAEETPQVTTRRDGQHQIVTVTGELKDAQHQPSGIRVETVYDCRWGYVKIHRELDFGSTNFQAREICPVTTVLAPTLTSFGYQDGRSEQEGADGFSFGSCHWGGVTATGGPAITASQVPHHVILANPGIEGIEWFAADDLAQWEMPVGGRRGQGKTVLEAGANPPGIRLAISPFANGAAAVMPRRLVFDFYLAVPLLEGHAFKPWANASFNRNRGNWVTPEQIRQWAADGIQTVHCHNDGDYYGDGLYWRDGSYPPYPDMDKYDAVIAGCHRAGLRVATYFSNKELNPETPEYKGHGLEWGRMNQAGRLEHNGFDAKSEFGAQMCLRSGWLGYLEHCVDRVLTHHKLDGVYYDWNVALRCSNPLHEGLNPGQAAASHWDIDELLALMEWTRQRVGPSGLVIIHDTSTPMYATENFASQVVAHEWGYPRWTGQGPDLAQLPLEWSLVNSRPRGVISYNMVGANAPAHLQRLFALEALLCNVSPWPASPESAALTPLLQPVGKIADCRFADWRNQAVTLHGGRLGSAIFSRPGEAWIVAGNLEETARETVCTVNPAKLPYPLATVTAASLVPAGKSAVPVPLDARQLTGAGVKLTIPGDSAILVRVR